MIVVVEWKPITVEVLVVVEEVLSGAITVVVVEDGGPRGEPFGGLLEGPCGEPF